MSSSVPRGCWQQDELAIQLPLTRSQDFCVLIVAINKLQIDHYIYHTTYLQIRLALLA